MLRVPIRIALRRLHRWGLLALLLLLSGGGQFATAQDGPTLPGQIAYVGVDGNVYVTDDLTAEATALTNDAQRGVRAYQWPTWSTDGRLAFFGQEVTQREGESSLLLNVFITPPGGTDPALAHTSETDTLTYAYWAPGNCPTSPTCRDLALLTSVRGGLRVLRVRDEAPDFSVKALGLGGPFYYSYSPDGSQMLWQRAGNQIDVYDAFADEITASLPDDVGRFQAPMWSPVDDQLLFAAFDEDGAHNLVVAEGDTRRVIAADQRGTLAFTWSPDGQYVAYKSDLDAVHIVDAATSADVVRSGSDRVVAFFWAPDSRKLAYLALPSTDDAPRVQADPGGRLAAPARQANPVLVWHVMDLTTNQQWSSFRGFVPTRDMVYYLSFFDQFAQSHRVWSPDSRYLVFAERTAAASTISLLDTTDPAAPPQAVAPGTIGIWSFE